MPFLSTYIDVRTVNFSHLLNPDWSIQISRAPAVCKERGGRQISRGFKMLDLITCESKVLSSCFFARELVSFVRLPESEF